MSALFNFESFLTVVLLVICTCTYIKIHFPRVLERKTGFRGFFWKAARIGIAFVEFGDKEGLEKAIRLNGEECCGRALVVNELGSTGTAGPGGGKDGGRGRGDSEKTVFVKGFEKNEQFRSKWRGSRRRLSEGCNPNVASQQAH